MIKSLFINRNAAIFLGLALLIIFLTKTNAPFGQFALVNAQLPGNEGGVTIADYEKTKAIINWNSLFNTNVSANSTGFVITVQGQSIYNSNVHTPSDIFQINDTGLKVSFYSLSFLREALENDFITDNIQNLREIKEIVFLILDKSDSFPILDRYIFNDHAVSERLESLLLFYAFLEGQQESRDTLKVVLGDIRRLARLLNNNSFFTYNTNHGLMQLRSLLAYSAVTKDKSYVQNTLSKLHDVYPIFVANDGSILEAATGYHIVIYNLLNTITELLYRHVEENVYQDYLGLLGKQQQYLSNIILADGFLQGAGDSNSHLIEEPQLRSGKNMIYHYANGLAGVKMRDGENVYGVMFVSLDNPPNIHKLPEDLSVYVYMNQPIFSNSGSYSYGKDRYRASILSGETQNGPKFLNTKITHSSIDSVEVSESGVVFEGQAVAGSSTLTRTVQYKNGEGRIDITDTSDSMLKVRFIVHPEIRLEVIDSHTIKLIGEKSEVVFQSDEPVEIMDTWVSPDYLEKRTTKSINILAKKNTIRIQPAAQLPRFRSINSSTVAGAGVGSLRHQVIGELKEKYDKSLTDIKRLNFAQIVVVTSWIFVALLTLGKREILMRRIQILHLVNIMLLVEVATRNNITLTWLNYCIDLKNQLINT